MAQIFILAQPNRENQIISVRGGQWPNLASHEYCTRYEYFKCRVRVPASQTNEMLSKTSKMTIIRTHHDTKFIYADGSQNREINQPEVNYSSNTNTLGRRVFMRVGLAIEMGFADGDKMARA